MIRIELKLLKTRNFHARARIFKSSEMMNNISMAQKPHVSPDSQLYLLSSHYDMPSPIFSMPPLLVMPSWHADK